MNIKKLTLVELAGVLVIILGVVGVWWFFGNKPGSNLPLQSAQTLNASTSLQTYTNSQYGFGVQYPIDVNVQQDSNGATFSYKGSKGYSEGNISIVAKNDQDSITNCLIAHVGYEQSGSLGIVDGATVKINGIDFLKYNSGDAAIGVYSSTAHYRTILGNSCLSIDNYNVIYGGQHLPKDEQVLEGIEQSAVQSKLDSILQSLTLTGSIKSVALANMHLYADTSFGFSFWYPSEWQVEQTTIGNPAGFPGGAVTKRLYVENQNKNIYIYIDEVYSPTYSVTDNDYYDSASSNPSAPVTYFFDVNTHTWMTTTAADHSSNSSPADVSNDTMGGLHMLSGISRYHGQIIPLSSKNFLFVRDSGYYDIQNLAKTIVAINPSVATPVSAVEQIKVIQAEAKAYTGQQ